jgi:hexosaminidase
MKLSKNDLALVPQPQKIRLNGDSFEAGGARMHLSPNNAETRALGGVLKQALRLKSGGKKAQGKIQLRLEAASKSLGPEGYKLEITNQGIHLSAWKGAGLFYGIQTLKQLRMQGAVLPGLSIEDKPRFPWRGFMLDTARSFFPISYIFKQIDLLALHKMNRFHWHLTEDQGWRLEIKKYPRLTSFASRRGKGETLPAMSGFYTQKQARQVVAYAKARYITVVPEIEMPGHNQAALAAYPWLGCNGGPYKVQTEWGIHKDVLCAGKESTFEFLENVINEVVKIFPSPWFHVGGDECPKDRWHAHKRCQDRMKEHHLKDERELQSWFLSRAERMLAKRGKRMIGWDEIHEGGVPGDAIVHWWISQDAARDAARDGHQVIASPHAKVYLDHPHSTTTLENLYGFSPWPSNLSPAARKRALGGEAPLWTERVHNTARADFMAWPRLCALSENLWSEPENKNFENFKKRLLSHQLRLKALGVQYRDPGQPVGRWRPKDLSRAGRKNTWVLSTGTGQSGNFELTFDYEGGKSLVAIKGLNAKAGAKSLALKPKEKSPGAGHRSQEPVYRFSVPAAIKNKPLKIQAALQSKSGTDSHGTLYLKRV